MTDLPLLADVHISPLTCKGLRNAGYRVARVTEVLSARTPDGEILKYAREHGHVILTQDLDFSALVAQSGQTAPSIVSLRLETPTPDRVTTVLLNVLPGLLPDLKRGVLVSIDEKSVRIRVLPVGSES